MEDSHGSETRFERSEQSVPPVVQRRFFGQTFAKILFGIHITLLLAFFIYYFISLREAAKSAMEEYWNKIDATTMSSLLSNSTSGPGNDSTSDYDLITSTERSGPSAIGIGLGYVSQFAILIVSFIISLSLAITGLVGVCLRSRCRIVVGIVGAIWEAIWNGCHVFLTPSPPVYMIIILIVVVIYFIFETVALLIYQCGVRRPCAGGEEPDEVKV